MIITQEMLFENNVRQIVADIETEYQATIMADFERNPDEYPDLLTWLEKHPTIVGEAFMKHIINYGFNNEEIS